MIWIQPLVVSLGLWVTSDLGQLLRGRESYTKDHSRSRMIQKYDGEKGNSNA